ncbi:hypothetical protein CC56_2893, partial [Bordetella pertussis H934]
QRPGHRVTGNRRDTVEGAGWDFVFVAIDDHARVAFTDIHPDERFPSAVQFLKDAVAYYQRLGMSGLAVAAAVATVAWVAHPYLTGAPTGETRVLADATPASAGDDAGLRDYLEAHRQVAGPSAVRQVSFDAGAGR